MINTVSVVSRGGLKFIIMDAPNIENADHYASQLQSHGVLHLVRICEGRYNDSAFTNLGISIHVLSK